MEGLLGLRVGRLKIPFGIYNDITTSTRHGHRSSCAVAYPLGSELSLRPDRAEVMGSRVGWRGPRISRLRGHHLHRPGDPDPPGAGLELQLNVLTRRGGCSGRRRFRLRVGAS